MKKFLAISILALSLGACAQFQTALNDIQNTYTYVTTTTVDPQQAAVVANAFDALKATAANYGQYCVTQKFPQPICSASNRRVVIKAINAGTAARIQIETAITSSQPVTGTLYNALVAAVQSLQSSVITTVSH